MTSERWGQTFKETGGHRDIRRIEKMDLEKYRLKKESAKRKGW